MNLRIGTMAAAVAAIVAVAALLAGCQLDGGPAAGEPTGSIRLGCPPETRLSSA